MDWLLPFAVMSPLILVLLIVALGRRSPGADQARRLAAVERKLDLVMAHLGIHEPEPDAVLRELRAGRKIQAIKIYREVTGAGLRDAKEAVEALARQHGLE
jgi:ribosomal protein L7/L12